MYILLTIINHTHHHIAPREPLNPGRLHIKISSGVSIPLQHSCNTVGLSKGSTDNYNHNHNSGFYVQLCVGGEKEKCVICECGVGEGNMNGGL